MRYLSYLLAAIICLTVSVYGCSSSNSTHGESSETAEHHHGHDHEHSGHEHGHEHEHEHEHNHDGHTHESDSHDGEIVFSEENQARFGVEVETVTPAKYANVIHTGGVILPARGEECIISASTSGILRFRDRTLAEGSYLKKGNSFAVINTQTVDGGDPVSKARSAYETAEKEYLRDKELLKDNIISASHYERSKLEYEQAKAAYEALSRSGYSNEGLNVNAPISGYFSAIYAKEGQYVTIGETIAVISSSNRLSLRADLPVRYASSLGKIVSANFSTADGNILSTEALHGRLLGFSRTAVNNFLPVSFEFDGTNAAVPGTYVNVWLKTDEVEDAITVPLDAIVESQGIKSVFIQHEDDAFMKRDVTIIGNDGVRARVSSGLKSGDKVVVKGAMQIKLASVSAVPSGHNHQH